MSGGAIKPLLTPGQLGLLGVLLGLLGVPPGLLGLPPGLPLYLTPLLLRHYSLTPTNDFQRRKYCCSCNYYHGLGY